MIAYASWTGTKRNLAAMREHGWRLLISSEGHHGAAATEGWRYALDNGAWTAHQQNREWDEAAFLATLDRLGADADWVVAPDIVMGGAESLARTARYLDRCLQACPRVLIAVQNGIDPRAVDAMLAARSRWLGVSVGLFIGGDTGYKLTTLQRWCNVAHERGCWLHVGRVNSERRIRSCLAAGATSFDGTSPTRFAVNTPRLTRALPTLPIWSHA